MSWRPLNRSYFSSTWRAIGAIGLVTSSVQLRLISGVSYKSQNASGRSQSASNHLYSLPRAWLELLQRLRAVRLLATLR